MCPITNPRLSCSNHGEKNLSHTCVPFHGTSRKHGEKESQLFSYCSSFDHPNLCSHITITKLYFSFCDCKFKCLGVYNIMLEMYSQDLSNRILQAPISLKCPLLSQEKQICDCLATAKHGGQMNRNGKKIAVLFHHVFY